jgi:type II secretory pathway pseudopilin PulG
MRKWNVERGMSLVEATIILMVLAVLTAVVAPSVGDYLEDARHTKAKEDVEAIGDGIIRTLRDSQVSCLVKDTPGGGCVKVKRADQLYGANGNYLGVSSTAGDYVAPANTTTDTKYNWKGATQTAGVPEITRSDTIEHQLVTNTPSYTTVASNFTPSMNTVAGVGWRGPYVTGPLGADPWGSGYQANTLFLGTATNAGGTTGEGELNGGWNKDVFVVSAGPNGLIDTPFAATGTGAKAVADDLIFVVQGSTK